MTTWHPPRNKPPTESAGWLGYYTRRYLREEFDLMDCDGSYPPLWFYRKSATRVVRFYEEKPYGQEIRPSQSRILPVLCALGIQCYVIHDAERLGAPEFPIRVTRVAANGDQQQSREFHREEFDQWLRDGLGEPPHPSRSHLDELLELPYDPPPGCDPDLWRDLDRLLVAIAKRVGGAA